MKLFDKIQLLLEKDEMIYNKHGFKIKLFFILSILSFIIFICVDFYNAHGYYLQLVFIKENLNWETFKLSVIIIEKFLRKLFGYFPWYCHVLFIVAIILCLLVDYLCACAVLLLYIFLTILMGIHIELHTLVRQAASSLIVTDWFRIDLFYTDEYMINFAYNFLELFNMELGTDYPIADPELLAEWILQSSGKPGALLEILVRVYNEYHQIMVAVEKARRRQKQNAGVFWKLTRAVEEITNWLTSWWK